MFFILIPQLVRRFKFSHGRTLNFIFCFDFVHLKEVQNNKLYMKINSLLSLFCQRWKFSSDQQISSLLRKMFGNKMCQTWSKQLENDGLRELWRGPLFFLSFFISEYFHLCFLCNRSVSGCYLLVNMLCLFCCLFLFFSVETEI